MTTTKMPAKLLLPVLGLAATGVLGAALAAVPLGAVSVLVLDAVVVEDSTAVEVEMAALVDLSAPVEPTGTGILAPVVALAEDGTGMIGATPEGAPLDGAGLTAGAGAPGVIVARKQVSACTTLMSRLKLTSRGWHIVGSGL